jgi:hypothetical protein
MLLTIVNRRIRLSSDARIEEEEESLKDQFGHQASRINCSPLPILSKRQNTIFSIIARIKVSPRQDSNPVPECQRHLESW